MTPSMLLGTETTTEHAPGTVKDGHSDLHGGTVETSTSGLY